MTRQTIHTPLAPQAIGTYSQAVRAGDTVNARVTITEVMPQKRRVTLTTVCTVADQVVLEGEAQVIVPSRVGN